VILDRNPFKVEPTTNKDSKRRENFGSGAAQIAVQSVVKKSRRKISMIAECKAPRSQPARHGLPCGREGKMEVSSSFPEPRVVNLLWFLLIGVAAGWLASQIMKGGGSGLVTDLIMGVIGSILGGFLFGLFGLSADGALGSLVTATVGAIVLIAGLRAINRSRI